MAKVLIEVDSTEDAIPALRLVDFWRDFVENQPVQEVFTPEVADALTMSLITVKNCIDEIAPISSQERAEKFRKLSLACKEAATGIDEWLKKL